MFKFACLLATVGTVTIENKAKSEASTEAKMALRAQHRAEVAEQTKQDFDYYLDDYYFDDLYYYFDDFYYYDFDFCEDCDVFGDCDDFGC